MSQTSTSEFRTGYYYGKRDQGLADCATLNKTAGKLQTVNIRGLTLSSEL